MPHHIVARILILIGLLCSGFIAPQAGYSAANIVSPTNMPKRGTWGEPVSIYQSTSAAGEPISLVEHVGRLHALLGYGGYRQIGGCEKNAYTGLLYAERDLVEGNWSQIVRVPLPDEEDYDYVCDPQMLVDAEGVVHIVWTVVYLSQGGNYYVGHLSKPFGGEWSAVEKQTPIQGIIAAKMGLDGTLYISGRVPWIQGGWLLIRTPAGVWSGESAPIWFDQIEVDQNGNLHGITNYRNLAYYYKPSGLSWSEPISLTTNVAGDNSFHFLLDPQGHAHVSWLQSFSYECFPTTCWASRLQHQEIISGAPGPITDVSGQINFGVTPIFQRSGDGMLHFFWAGAENPSNPHDLTYYRKKLPDGSWSEIEIFDGKLTHAFVGDQGDVQLLLNSQYVERHIWYTPALGWSLSTTGDGLVLFAWGAQIVAAQEGWQKPTHPLEVISGYKDGFGVYRVFARRFAPPDYHYLYVPDIHH